MIIKLAVRASSSPTCSSTAHGWTVVGISGWVSSTKAGAATSLFTLRWESRLRQAQKLAYPIWYCLQNSVADKLLLARSSTNDCHCSALWCLYRCFARLHVESEQSLVQAVEELNNVSKWTLTHVTQCAQNNPVTRQFPKHQFDSPSDSDLLELSMESINHLLSCKLLHATRYQASLFDIEPTANDFQGIDCSTARVSAE